MCSNIWPPNQRKIDWSLTVQASGRSQWRCTTCCSTSPARFAQWSSGILPAAFHILISTGRIRGRTRSCASIGWLTTVWDTRRCSFLLHFPVSPALALARTAATASTVWKKHSRLLVMLTGLSQMRTTGKSSCMFPRSYVPYNASSSPWSNYILYFKLQLPFPGTLRGDWRSHSIGMVQFIR